MIIQGSHAPCPIPYHTFFPNRMLIGKLMYPLRLSKTYPQKSLSPPRFPFLETETFLTVKECFFSTSPSLLQGELHIPLQASPFSEGRGCNRPTRCSNRYAIRMADHQKSALVFCAGWDRLAVLLGPLPSGEETILQKGLCTLLRRRSKMAAYI